LKLTDNILEVHTVLNQCIQSLKQNKKDIVPMKADALQDTTMDPDVAHILSHFNWSLQSLPSLTPFRTSVDDTVFQLSFDNNDDIGSNKKIIMDINTDIAAKTQGKYRIPWIVSLQV
jgi:hypothetical protein